MENPKATFQEIDFDWSGTITFDEFCDWSIKKNLDMDAVAE